jgi:hypothetical protein
MRYLERAVDALDRIVQRAIRALVAGGRRAR